MVDANISSDIGDIRVVMNKNAQNFNIANDSFKKARHFEFTEYSIKESDYRIKTATFTTPLFFDLTKGQYLVLIKSIYHENFSGIILDVDYDEKTGLYTYQCQDWSRNLISKFEAVGKFNVYLYLRTLMTGGSIPYGTSYAKLKKAGWASVVAGLKSLDRYNQSYYKGNKYKGNPFNQKRQLVIRDKSYIEVIRDLVFNSLGYFDVWFNSKGVLQITPLSKTDWENTGLHLTDDGYTDRKFKFSTTNAITGVRVNGSDLKMGVNQNSNEILGLDLSAFFGKVRTSIGDPNNKNTTKAATTSSNKTTTTSTTTVGKNGNPFNNKKKKIMVCADGGDRGFKNAMVKLLKKDGWQVTDLGIGPGKHSKSYNIIDKSYAVNLVIANGFCAGSVRECITGWLKGHHEKLGVAYVQMWDTGGWTNPRGMKPYRYGDFRGYSAKRAWDDNFSRGNPAIKNVMDYFKKYKVKYCCGPTAAQAYKQFKAGGYLKMKGYVK